MLFRSSSQLSRIWSGPAAWALWACAALAPAAAQPQADLRPLVPEGEVLAVSLEEAAELLAEVRPRQAILALAWHPNGKELATGSAHGTVTLWDLETGLEKRRLEDASSAVRSLTYSHDGRWLASGSDAGFVRLWDLAIDRRPRRLDGWAVAFSPRDNRLATGARDGVVKIFDPQNPEAEPLSWPGHSEQIAALAWDPGGTYLATGSWDRTVKFWNISDGNFLRRLANDHGERVNAISWGPGGKLLASASADSTVRIWDPDTGEELRHFGGHRTAATAVAWHPDGHTVASASRDGTVRLWSYVVGNEVAQLENYGGKVFTVDFDPSGRLLAAGTEEGFVGIWAFSTGQLVRQLGGEAGAVEALAFDHQEQTLAVGSKGEIRLWTRAEPPRAPSMLSLAGDRAPRCLALNATGDTLAAGFQDGPIVWWRRASGGTDRFERQAPLPAHTYAPAALEFSPSGELLAAGFDDGAIHVRDLATRELFRELRYPPSEKGPPYKRNLALTFSPDGASLVGAFADRTLYQWDLESQNLLSTASWRTGGDALAVRFVSPTRVIAVLRGGEVLLWDIGQRSTRLAGRLEHSLNVAAFGTAGWTLATVGQREGVVRIESPQSQGVFSLTRVLLGGTRGHWVDCRLQGRCYRHDDGTSLIRRSSGGDLEPVPLQRSEPAPELELAEPPQENILVADGEVEPLIITLRNRGPQRAVWVNVRQASLELQNPVVFYAPPVQVVVEPGQTIELHGGVSMHSVYESPTIEKADLKLVVTSAGSKHLFLDPIRVTNAVPVVEWRGAWLSAGGERLWVELANTGGGPFSADLIVIRAPDPIVPIETDIFRDLARFAWELSAESRANLSQRLDLVAYRSQLPVHRWSFENQRVLRLALDRFYLILLLALLVVTAYVRPRIASWLGLQGRSHERVSTLRNSEQ